MRRGGNIENLSTDPWYAFTTGAKALVIVGSNEYTAPRMGLVQTMGALNTAQFVSSSVVDHFGLLGDIQRSLDLQRLARHKGSRLWHLAHHSLAECGPEGKTSKL